MADKAKTAMLHVRVDSDLKGEAQYILEELGIPLSTVVRMLLTRIVEEGGLPVELVTTKKMRDEFVYGRLKELLDKNDT